MCMNCKSISPREHTIDKEGLASGLFLYLKGKSTIAV